MPNAFELLQSLINGLGVGLVYLCVRPERSGFYERPGWIPIERDVGERHPSAFIRDAIPETKINRSPP